MLKKGGSIMQRNILSRYCWRKRQLNTAQPTCTYAAVAYCPDDAGEFAPAENTGYTTIFEAQDEVASHLVCRKSRRGHSASKLQRDKVVDFSYSMHGFGRFRCNFYMQRGTYAIAVRMLPLAIPAFETLNLPETILRFHEEE